MWYGKCAIMLLSGALLLGAGGSYAAGEQQAAERSTAQNAANEPIYGSQLMSRAERIEHRNKMRSFKTAEEREQYRLEHHAQMQQRAREKGMALPDTPPAGGMGRGLGRGPGIGPGGGMGPGAGR